jgi:hypothetical protein
MNAYRVTMERGGGTADGTHKVFSGTKDECWAFLAGIYDVSREIGLTVNYLKSGIKVFTVADGFSKWVEYKVMLVG